MRSRVSPGVSSDGAAPVAARSRTGNLHAPDPRRAVYQRTKKRLGRQRGPKVAQIDLSRKLTEAIWHMLTRNQPFAPAGARFV